VLVTVNHIKTVMTEEEKGCIAMINIDLSAGG